MKGCKGCLLATVLLGWASTGWALESIHRLFDTQESAPRPFSGVLLVAKGDKLLVSHHANWPENSALKPIDKTQRFTLGAIARQITAALVMQEVDAGHLSLSHEVEEWLPEYQTHWQAKMPIRQLLSHSDGVFVRDWYQGQEGEVFAYENLGYNLAGDILESVTGKPYQELADEVLQRCQMQTSATHSMDKPTAQSAKGFMELQPGELAPVYAGIPDDFVASSGLQASAMELLSWNLCLHRGKLLSEQSYRQMVTSSSLQPHRWGTLGHGFGIQISDKPVREYSQSGYVPGFISTLAYYPDSNISLIVLENVSWDPEDTQRAYYYHDKSRQALLGYLSRGEGRSIGQ